MAFDFAAGEVRAGMNQQDAELKIEDLLDVLLEGAQLDLTYTLDVSDALPYFQVEFEGPDVPMLLSRNGELLLALEHVAAKTIGLEPEQHDQISFEAANFKAGRERALQAAARRAVEAVKATGRPYSFPPMNSRERRLLHLALASFGVATESEGEGSLRHLVVHPARTPR